MGAKWQFWSTPPPLDDGIRITTAAHEHVPNEPPLEIVPFSETEFTEGEARALGSEHRTKQTQFFPWKLYSLEGRWRLNKMIVMDAYED